MERDMWKFGPKLSQECINWGEASNEFACVVPEEVKRTVISGAVKPEDPKIKLPVTEDETEEFVTLAPEFSRPNLIVRHTIKLNQHAKSVQRLLRVTMANKNDYRKCPLVPDASTKKRKNAKLKKYEMINKGKYKFDIGQGPNLPKLHSETLEAMMKKAVVIILAQTGFDKAKKSALAVLIDVVKEVFTRIANLLHSFCQTDVLRGRIAYNDTVEKTLQDLGFKGIKGVDSYWKKQIVGKCDRALIKSQKLYALYTQLVAKLVAHTQGLDLLAEASKRRTLMGPPKKKKKSDIGKSHVYQPVV